MITIKKQLVIILGNGFTIDLIKHLKKDSIVDAKNLFKHGHLVPWPSNNEAGFLSYKYCPNLWSLSARPCTADDESISLIEDIITCANISPSTLANENIYANAYKELAIYLKHLFIYYNNKIADDEIKNSIDDWSWFKFLKKVYNSSEYKKIYIITYNYDIWLERILSLKSIPFKIGVIEREGTNKIVIVKPHGSISFTHSISLPKDSFEISYKKTLRELLEGKARDFEIKYNNLDKNYPINAIIPPAGDSERLKFGWAKEIREYAKNIASKLDINDELIICGISYWHVDRIEIDELLTSINPQTNIKVINPSPPRTLNAVLSSIFGNYILYTSSNILGV